MLSTPPIKGWASWPSRNGSDPADRSCCAAPQAVAHSESSDSWHLAAAAARIGRRIDTISPAILGSLPD